MNKNELRLYIREMIQQEDNIVSKKEAKGLLHDIKKDIDLLKKDINNPNNDMVKKVEKTIRQLEFLKSKVKSSSKQSKSNDELSQVFNKNNKSKVIDEESNQ